MFEGYTPVCVARREGGLFRFFRDRPSVAVSTQSLTTRLITRRRTGVDIDTICQGLTVLRQRNLVLHSPNGGGQRGICHCISSRAYSSGLRVAYLGYNQAARVARGVSSGLLQSILHNSGFGVSLSGAAICNIYGSYH